MATPNLLNEFHRINRLEAESKRNVGDNANARVASQIRTSAANAQRMLDAERASGNYDKIWNEMRSSPEGVNELIRLERSKNEGGPVDMLKTGLLFAGGAMGANALLGGVGAAGSAGAGSAGGVGAGGVGSGAGGVAGGATTVGATEAGAGGGVLDWANKMSKDTGGSGNALNDLYNSAKNNAPQLLAGGAGMYNSNQQGQAANDIANRQMELQRPYYEAGTNALNKMGQGVSAYQQDPYSKWLQDQGTQSISRSAAAKGMGNSGNVLTALSDYNQNIAGKGYQDWFGNQSTIAGYGSPAATNMGNAYATGRQGQADANSGATSAVLNTLNNIINNPTQNNGVSQPGYTNPYAQYTNPVNNQAWQTPGINPNVGVNPNPTTDFTQYLDPNWYAKQF